MGEEDVLHGRFYILLYLVESEFPLWKKYFLQYVMKLWCFVHYLWNCGVMVFV